MLPNVSITAVEDKDGYIPKCDIVSVATFSKDPLVYGKHLKSGAHLDLVGSFTPEMREADDECISRSTVFVDTYTALKESGDLAIPLSKGMIDQADIKMDLNELALSGYGRKSSTENTYFKSVGNAKSDLALAAFIYEHYQGE